MDLPASGPCEATRLFHLLGGKWTLPVLHQLHYASSPLRFGEIRRRVGGITTSELTKTLRLLESKRLVSRRAIAEVPLRVEYTCTELGMSLRGCLENLAEWLKRLDAELDNP